MAVKERRRALGILASCAALGMGRSAAAENFPARPIRLVVPSAAGGGTDVVARLVSDKMLAQWRQPGVVENRGGAGGNIGADLVYHASPDGYVLLLSSPGPVSINKSLYRSLAYDPDRMEPVSLISASPNVLVVHPGLPVRSVQELIDYARAHPDALNYGTPGNGSTPHLTTEWFKQLTGARITHVPYKGTGPAIADLMAGQIQVAFAEISTTVALAKSGRIKALGIASDKPSPMLPGVPTMSETLPGFISMSSSHLMAPPGTPKPIVARLSGVVAAVAKDPAAVRKLAEMGVEAIGSTPAEHARFLREERTRWAQVIERTGIKLD